MYQKDLGLADLVNLLDWQKIQDSFSDILGITLRTVDLTGKQLTKISGSGRLCNILPKKAKRHAEFCENYLKKNNGEKEIDIKDIQSFKCAFGADIFVIPIKALWSMTVAYIIVGPVILNKRKSEAEYRLLAAEIGIVPEELLDALIEINVFSYNKSRAIVKLLNDIFSYMALTEFHKKRLGEIGQEVIEVDPLFSSYYEEKILNTLLNTCMSALDIDSGSVMTVDQNTQRLHIKVASKIDQEIIKNTKVQMGEGIAGIAAANAKPIILPKDSGKKELFGRMNRKYIKSSMIVPFNKANLNNVYGVINLNVVRKDRKFTDKDVKLVQELINFASVALLPVK